MAAQTNRQVTLTLKAQTDGASSVRDLAEEIRKLAKNGGEAAPQFEKLSTELDQLAQQQSVVNAFQQISKAADDTRGSMNAAKEAVGNEQAALERLSATLAEARAAQEAHAQRVREAAAAVSGANTSLTEAKAAVARYTAEIGGARGATQEQTARLNQLRQAVREANAEHKEAKSTLAALRPELDRLNAGLREAEGAYGEQSRVVKKADDAVAALRDEYDQLSGALHSAQQEMAKAGVDTARVADEQNRLAQTMARLTNEAEQLKSSLAGQGQQALTTAQRIEQAFGVTGVRSTAAIKAEILGVNNALMTLARSANVTGADFDRAFAAGKARIAELESALHNADTKAKGFGASFGAAFKQFAPATVVFNGVTAAISALTAAARDIPKVTAEYESMDRALRVLTGSQEAARKEFEYIRNVANHVGADVKQLGDAYISLTAATKETVLRGTQTKRVFEAVAGAMGTLGKSSAETERALQAVSQMVSKGTVSMEEFRQQLSERLPGAMQVTARELGITVDELNALVSSGKLTAEYVLPALAAGLEKMYETQKRNDTLAGQWAQFGNAAKNYGNDIGEHVLKPLLAVGRYGAGALATVYEGLKYVGAVVAVIGKGIKDWDFSGSLGFLNEQSAGMKKRLADLFGVTDAGTKTMTQLAEEAKKAGQEFVTLADGTKVAVADILTLDNGLIKFLVTNTKAIDSAEGLATSARRNAEATRAAGEASITAANALGTEVDKRRVATQVALDNAAALSKVAETEGVVLKLMEEEAMKRAIAIRDAKETSDAARDQLKKLGEEIAKRKVVVDGYARQAEATRVLAEAQRIEAETALDNAGRVDQLRQRFLELTAASDELRTSMTLGNATQQQVAVVEEEARKAKKLYIDALKDEGEEMKAIATLSGNEKQIRDANIAAMQMQLDALDEMGQGRSDEAVKLEAQITQLTIERQALEDNSRALYAMAAAYGETKARVDDLRAAKAAGKDVTDALAFAERDAAAATALYKDALRDQQEVIKANLSAKQADISLQESGIRYSIESLRTVEQVARIKGDEAAAIDACNQMRQLEIRLAQLQAEAKSAEAAAMLETIKARRLELLVSGQLTEAKKAELRAQEAAAEAKQIEAAIAAEAARRLIQLEQATQEAAAASGDAASGYDKLAASLRGVSRAADEANSSMSLLDNRAFTSRTGGMDFATAAYQKGYSVEQVKAAAPFFNELLSQGMATKMTGNLMTQENFTMMQKRVIDEAVNGAIARAEAQGLVKDVAVTTDDLIARNLARTNWQMAGLTPYSGEQAQAAAIRSAGAEAIQRSTTVNINLGGKNTRVNVASPDDASALTSLFKQLESDSMRTF